MRILVVSPFLPYPGVPHAGGKLVHYLLAVLARRHSVVLLSRIFPGEERHVAGLASLLERVDVVPAPGPIRAGSVGSLLRTVASYRNLCRRARTLLRTESFDLCQVEYTETAVFLPAKLEVPSVLTCHDVIAKPAYRRFSGSKGFSRVTAWPAWRIAFAVECRATGKFRTVLTLSDEDREWAERLYPRGTFRVLRYPAGIGFEGIPRNPREGRVLFVGALNRPQNREALRFFLEHVWPSVHREVPGAEFCVVGAGMDADLRMELAGTPKVLAVGEVPEVEPYYASSAVFVAPILAGGGIIVKILDALGAGVPTVTTRYGNEGIRAREGEQILVADSPGEFAASVIRLLRDDAARKTVGEAGRRYVMDTFPEDAFVDMVDTVYRDVARAVEAR
jgi:glycosyltransferase involved in cell wall biosynthesis